MGRRLQFSLRALLAVMLAVACFFGGVHVGEQRPRPKDTARLAAAMATAETAQAQLHRMKLQMRFEKLSAELDRVKLDFQEAQSLARSQEAVYQKLIQDIESRQAEVDRLKVERIKNATRETKALQEKRRPSLQDTLDKVDSPRRLPGDST